MKRKALLLVCLVLATLMLFSSVGFAFTSVPVKSIGLNTTNLVMAVGQTTTLTAYISPVKATNKTVWWSSSNNAVAKVNAKGAVTAVAVGKAVITVQTNDKKLSAKCTITVEKSAKKVTLKWYGAGWQANRKADTIIARWNKIVPNVKVDYVELNNLVNDQFFQKYDTMIAAGEECDVVYLGVTDILKRASNGAMLPIGDYVKAAGLDLSGDYGSVAEGMFTVDGKLYGIPMALNTFKVFYNKDMFKAKGITIPQDWTFAQFRDIALKMNDPKNGVYGAFFPMTWQEMTYAMAEDAGWKMVVKDSSGAVKPNFDDSKFKKCMQLLYDFTMKDKVSPDLATSKAGNLNRRIYFAQKKAPMISDGYYALIFLQGYQFDTQGGAPIDFEIGVTDFPRLDESQPKEVTNATLVGGFGVPKTAKYPQQSVEFANFVCGNQNIDLMGGIPAYKKANIEDEIKTFTSYVDKKGVTHNNIYPDQVVIDALTINKQDHFSYYKNDPVLYAKYYAPLIQLYYQQYELYFTGQLSLDEFVKSMQTRGAEEIKKVD